MLKPEMKPLLAEKYGTPSSSELLTISCLVYNCLLSLRLINVDEFNEVFPCLGHAASRNERSMPPQQIIQRHTEGKKTETAISRERDSEIEREGERERRDTV